jgi:hypothetical protein
MSMTNEEASNILRLVATEALEGVSRFVESENNRDMFKQAYEMAIKSLEESVSVVRCRDCKNWDTTWQNDWAKNYHYCPLIDGTRNGDWYCAYGEEKKE